MRAYVIRRLALVLITIFLVTIIAFLSVRFIPGSLVDLMVADKYREATGNREEMAAVIKEQLGLDVPIWQQYLRWLGVWPQKDGRISGVVEGDLGKSLWSERIIRDEILQRSNIPGAGYFCLDNRADNGFPHRHLLGDTTGHNRRLYREELCHIVHWCARLLAGNYGFHLPRKVV